MLGGGAAWTDQTGTALYKPDGTSVAVGAYLGEYLWANRPDPSTSPAYSRFFATDSMLWCEFVRASDGLSWLPMAPVTLMSGQSSSHTGTTALTTKTSITIPGGLLTGRKLVINVDVEKVGVAGNCDILFTYGSWTYFAFRTIPAAIVHTNVQWNITFLTAASQIGNRAGVLGSGVDINSGAGATDTVDSSVDQTMAFKFKLVDAADSVRLSQYLVQMVR